MWEGGKLFLRAGKPSDDEAAAALDRVEVRPAWDESRAADWWNLHHPSGQEQTLTA